MYWIIGGVAAVAATIWAMLSRVTARGGERSGAAADIAGPVLDEAAAFRGDAPEGREPWDGESRLRIKPNIFGV